MTREQAINYLICRGITEYQVSEIVRALTYKPRDCANCKHYIVKDTRTNWGSQETTKIYGCERWECEYEPTTKNNLGVDCISREATVKRLCNLAEYMNEHKENSGDPYIMAALFIQDNKTEFPSVTPQLSVPEVTALAEWTEKLTKECEEAYNKGYEDGMKAQAEPKTGHWKGDGYNYTCDKCGHDMLEIAHSADYISFKKSNYCPNCGADMREVEE